LSARPGKHSTYFFRINPAINPAPVRVNPLIRSKPATLARIVLAAYWLALIAATHVPATSDLRPLDTSDKILHALAYMVLALLLAGAWELSVGRLNGRHLGAAWLAVVAYAAIDEITQIPFGRECDFWDWVADAGGAAIGILLFIVVRRLVERRGQSA
jgi:VanZ family protein